MTHYYFIAGTIATETGNLITNTEVSLPGAIQTYTAIKEVERRFAEEFRVSSFTVTFYALLRAED